MSVSVRMALLGLAVCSMGFVATALADQGVAGYLSLSGGYNIPSGDLEKTDITSSDTNLPIPDYNLSMDDGWDVSLAVGCRVQRFRFEFQYTAQTNEFSKFKESNGVELNADGTMYSNLFMLNGYYDIPLADHLSLYVGGGVGALYMTHNSDSPDGEHVVDNQNGTAFAYQAMIGLEYQFDPMFSIFGGYRGWSALEVETQQSTAQVPWFNMVEVGLRVSF